METEEAEGVGRYGRPLETFLGGMETGPGDIAVLRELQSLETFLGGMETDEWYAAGLSTNDLETFLGGMETCFCDGYRRGHRGPLKPSLVEWKLDGDIVFMRTGKNLETFLGGMETQPFPRHGVAPRIP